MVNWDRCDHHVHRKWNSFVTWFMFQYGIFSSFLLFSFLLSFESISVFVSTFLSLSSILIFIVCLLCVIQALFSKRKCCNIFMWSQLTVKYNVRVDLHCFIPCVIRLPFANVLAFTFIVYFLHFHQNKETAKWEICHSERETERERAPE